LKRLVLHPFLLAVFPVLFLYAQNQGQLPPRVLALPLIATIVSTATLWISLRLFLRDSRKAGLLVSFFLLCFFSYGHLYNAVSGCYIGGFIIGRDRYLYPFWGILLISGTFFISRIKSDRRLAGFSSFLNFFSLFSVLISLSIIVGNSLNSPSNLVQQEPAWAADKGDLPSARGTLPDIYYIILDSYGSNNTLRTYFQFDNAEMTNYLRQKGFYVAGDAHSNYASTLLSLSSSLDMDYINSSIEATKPKSWNDMLLEERVKNSRVARVFRARGYKVINIGSGWDLSLEDDAPIRPEGFSLLLLDTSLLHMFRDRFLDDRVRDSILQAFQKLSDAADLEGPKFVFAHLMSPHPPFVFGPDGEKVSTREKVSGMSSIFNQRKRLYVDQLIFTNRKVLATIETILARSTTPPIILLQADHGCAYVHNPEVMDSRKPASQNLPDTTFLSEQMSIFSAYFLPRQCRDRLYDSITPVNSFRAILGFYFDQKLSLLEDRTYYSTHKHPYELVDVTAKVMSTHTSTP
jgi:hypothetical protein